MSHFLVPEVNKWNSFISSFLNCMTFLSFSCLVALLGLPIWCWMEVEKVYILASFLILRESIHSFTITYYVVLSCFSRARILEWVTMLSFRESSLPRDWTRVSCIAGRFFTAEPPGKSYIMLPVLCCAYLLSCVWLFATPWNEAHQAPLSMRVLQARILEWIAVPSSRGSPHSRDQTYISGSLPLVPPGKP